MLVREEGSITVSGKSETQPIVNAAYVKAEKEQRNTPQERQAGTHRWSGDGDIITAPEAMSEDGQRMRWNDYCSRMNPKWTGGKGSIIPTRPPHPIGATGKKATPMQDEQADWKAVIGDWVEGVRREDAARASQGRESMRK